MRSVIVLGGVLVLGLAGCGRGPGAPDGGIDAQVPDMGTVVRYDTGLIGFDGGPVTMVGCSIDYAACPVIVDRTMFPSAAIGIQPDAAVYFPPCVRIIAGATVQFQATPEQPVVDAPCSPGGSPIPGGAGATANAGYRFADPGVYGFYSPNDGLPNGTGMAGLVIVDPPPMH